MISQDDFLALLKKHARAESASMNDVLFGDDIGISSIAFTEFILELEEIHETDIDLDNLDASIRTAGHLYKRLCSLL